MKSKDNHIIPQEVEDYCAPIMVSILKVHTGHYQAKYPLYPYIDSVTMTKSKDSTGGKDHWDLILPGEFTYHEQWEPPKHNLFP